MCSNYVHESDLNERWCSLQCLLTARTDIGDKLIRDLNIGSTSAVGNMGHILQTLNPRVERNAEKDVLKEFVKVAKPTNASKKGKKRPYVGKYAKKEKVRLERIEKGIRWESCRALWGGSDWHYG